MKKKDYSCEDSNRLRPFLSLNPFFKEMDENLEKTGYKSRISVRHPSIEMVWLQNIHYSALISRQGDVMANIGTITGIWTKDYEPETREVAEQVMLYLALVKRGMETTLITDLGAAMRWAEDMYQDLLRMGDPYVVWKDGEYPCHTRRSWHRQTVEFIENVRKNGPEYFVFSPYEMMMRMK